LHGGLEVLKSNQNKMTLKYYYDLMSQPSRAVYIFLKANGIAFEAKPIALRKGMSKYGHCS